MNIDVVRVNYDRERHADDLIQLFSAYAGDPMVSGTELPDSVKSSLIGQLKVRKDAFSLIAYCWDEDSSNAVGFINAFEGFSTFAAKPLMNIHDVYVDPAYRGRGILNALFKEIEALSISRGCCKLTLEILSDNGRAQRSYRRLGFGNCRSSGGDGHTLFWQKRL